MKIHQTFRVKTDLLEKIKKLAADKRWSVSSTINYIIETYFKSK